MPLNLLWKQYGTRIFFENFRLPACQRSAWPCPRHQTQTPTGRSTIANRAAPNQVAGVLGAEHPQPAGNEREESIQFRAMRCDGKRLSLASSRQFTSVLLKAFHELLMCSVRMMSRLGPGLSLTSGRGVPEPRQARLSIEVRAAPHSWDLTSTVAEVVTTEGRGRYNWIRRKEFPKERRKRCQKHLFLVGYTNWVCPGVATAGNGSLPHVN